MYVWNIKCTGFIKLFIVYIYVHLHLYACMYVCMITHRQANMQTQILTDTHSLHYMAHLLCLPGVPETLERLSAGPGHHTSI